MPQHVSQTPGSTVDLAAAVAPGTAYQLLAIARAEVGQGEHPPGSNRDCFVWIGLHEPTTETPDYRDATSEVDVGEIMMFLRSDFVVSVRHGAANPLGPVRRRLEADTALLAHGPAAVVHAICDEVVDHYGVVAHEVEADIIELERAIFTPPTADVTEAIYSREREVLEFRAAEDPLIPVLQQLVRGRVTLFDGTREYFRDVLDHLLQVDGQVDAHNELLNSALTAHLALLGGLPQRDWSALRSRGGSTSAMTATTFANRPGLSSRRRRTGSAIGS